jgi:hypothetical protein
MENLREFWSELNLDEKPFIHRIDAALSQDLCYSYSGLTDYYNEKYWSDPSLFHTDLIPIPYVGNLQSATIFLLMLNPGFSLSDYYSECSSPDFVNALKANLRQDFSNSDFPFLYLNPNFLWNSGGEYWLKKLKDYISMIKDDRSCTYIEATQVLSQKIAVLELLPYHSTNFKQHNLLSKLESVKQMQKFVKEYLLPKVKKGEACIICTRGAKEWGLSDQKNLLVYNASEARGAYISKNTRAFPLIEKFLKE